MSVRLFYDVVSPYSYIAFKVLERYKSIWPNVEITYEPFLLGNQPPATLPARRKFLFLDISRNSQLLGIPLKLPSVFPANTIKAQRVLTWLKMNDYKNVSVLTDALYEAYWGGLDLDISQDTVLVKVFEKVGGDKEWLAKADIEAVKKELKDRTDEAVALGAFGAPTMICTNSAGKTEFFFGSDRFEHVAMFLGEEWKGYSPKESKL